MRRGAIVLAGLLIGLLASAPTPALAVPIEVTVVMVPTQVRTALGGRFTVDTEITNTGTVSTGTLLAHLNIVSTEGSVYVDPEDWSADRSQELSLQPGGTRTLTWEVQAVNSGTFAAYVVVLPFGNQGAGAVDAVVSLPAQLKVAERSTLDPGGALPVVVLVPVLLGLTAVAAHVRRRRRTG